MEQKYVFEYENENEFKKLESALKKYNMLAFKKLCFEYYPKIKAGDFVGSVVSKDDTYTYYDLSLPTDAIFIKVHGEVVLHYKVDVVNKKIIIVSLSPVKILSEGHQSELVTYKGVMVSNEEKDKDMFKINLLKMIQK